MYKMDRRKSQRLAEKAPLAKMDNIVRNGNQHPLLNPLIVEKVLEYCKVSNKDGNQFFPSLRLVCRTWNEECSKILRRETQIPIARLLEPYPEGLGWTENRCHGTSGLKHYYKCPLPTTREFQNFWFTATCQSFKDRKVHRWFGVMGKQIKSLHFTIALTCFHQNEFLANVLHKWCPNLETLQLDGIQCFPSLLYMFEVKIDAFPSYKECAKSCKKLRSLTISVDGDRPYKDCVCKVDQLTCFRYEANIENIKKILDDLKTMINLLPNIYLTLNPAISSLFYQLIKTGNNDGNIFSKIVSKYPRMYGVDWGVLGHILKSAPLQKLVIKNLVNISQTQELVLFLLCQPNKLRSTLEHLEFQNASLSGSCLKTLSLLKCPLSTFIVDQIVWRFDSGNYLQDILKNCAETLIYFEVGVEIIIYEANYQRSMNCLQVPLLPKLKSFTNKTIGLLHIDGLELFQNTPNLKQCSILNLRCEGNNAIQKHYTARALHKFCAKLNNIAIKGHPLKTLKIKLGIESYHVMLLRRGLVNLVNVELHILDPLNLLLSYPNSCGWDKLEAVTLSIGNVVSFRNFGQIDLDLTKCFEKFKCLKFFELTFHKDNMGYLPFAAHTSFAKLPELRSFKINNLCILEHENRGIEWITQRIPFVSFWKKKVISREDFRREVGNE